MIQLDNNLYIGLGNSPAGYDNAIIARVSQEGVLTAEHSLDEQGVHDMHLYNGKIYVAGTDATESWDYGNLYIRSAEGVWTKRRTIPLTMHTWGMCHDSSGSLWVATGSHAGDNATWQGRVMRSDDDGLTWALNTKLNDFRVFDIIEFGTRMYAVAYNWDGAYVCQLWRSSNAGIDWSLVSGITPHPYQRLVPHNGRLYAFYSDRLSLLEIRADGTTEIYSLPARVNGLPLNCMTSDGTYLYMVDENGAIWRSTDMSTWVQRSLVVNAVSLGYWPAKNCVVASDYGSNARLWLISV